MVASTNISIRAAWAATNKAILFYPENINVQYDHIPWIGPQIRWDCYMHQIEIKFVVLATKY